MYKQMDGNLHIYTYGLCQHMREKKFTFPRTKPTLALCLQVLFADNLCKQFGSRSGPTKSGSKLYDILMVSLNEFFVKDAFEKNQQTIKRMKNYPACRVK